VEFTSVTIELCIKSMLLKLEYFLVNLILTKNLKVMKTLKVCIVLCIVLAFLNSNVYAQKPIVEYDYLSHYELCPDPAFPCLTECISGDIPVHVFYTNSTFWTNVFHFTYHEKGEGVLYGSSGEQYEISWFANATEKNFDDPDGFWPKHWSYQNPATIRHDGKIFLVIRWQWHGQWNAPDTDPIVDHLIVNADCHK
jgi:hypothetical protein